jgi:hypothetical protein
VASESRIIWRPLLRNDHNKDAYYSGNKHISRRCLGNNLHNRDRIVEFPQQRYTLANAELKTNITLGQGVLSLVREALLKKVDFDSERRVRGQISEIAVSIQRKHSAQETQVKFSQHGNWEQRKQTVKVILSDSWSVATRLHKL